MPKNSRFSTLAFLILVFAVANIGSGALWVEFFANVDPDSRSFLALSYPVLAALSSIAAPFMLGWFVGRHGFIIGALIGLISGPFELLLAVNQMPSFGIAPLLLSSAVGAAITCSVAAAAGTLARSMYSNYSSKPTADAAA